jgi:diguanylate cyclase (GGDEF)-like protein
VTDNIGHPGLPTDWHGDGFHEVYTKPKNWRPGMNYDETVVVLDDDPGTAFYLKTCIETLATNWTVFAVQNAEEAIQILTEHPISCLVTDLAMPGQDGMETARQVRLLEERTGTLRFVLMLTGTKPDAKLEALELVNDFITKPADPREMLVLLKQGMRMTRRSVDMWNRNCELGKLANTDSLTGLSNRRHGLEVLEKELERWRRTGDSLSILLLDLDHFKQVNDRFGHESGDVVLKHVSLCMQEFLRPFDTVIRWGGEEFLVVLPHTDQASALVVGERLRLRVRTPVPLPDGKISISISIGMAAVSTPLESVETIVNNADRALYHAKNQGRNQVVAASNLPPESQFGITSSDEREFCP